MGEPVCNSDVESRVSAFCDDARAYCEFIDAWRAASVSQPFTKLLQLLSNLAKSGAALPWDGPGNSVEDVDRLDHEEWQIVAREIGDRVAEACNELISLNEEDVECRTRAIMLWDDLADIYRDLIHGLDQFAFGTPDHKAAAVFHWRLLYESHWGHHLFRALATVHEIRFRVFCE